MTLQTLFHRPLWGALLAALAITAVAPASAAAQSVDRDAAERCNTLVVHSECASLELRASARCLPGVDATNRGHCEATLLARARGVATNVPGRLVADIQITCSPARSAPFTSPDCPERQTVQLRCSWGVPSPTYGCTSERTLSYRTFHDDFFGCFTGCRIAVEARGVARTAIVAGPAAVERVATRPVAVRVEATEGGAGA